MAFLTNCLTVDEYERTDHLRPPLKRGSKDGDSARETRNGLVSVELNNDKHAPTASDGQQRQRKSAYDDDRRERKPKQLRR